MSDPMRGLLAEVKQSLDAFLASKSAFRVVKTVPSSSPATQPKTLFILDSSFNPPSRAHLSLATSALASQKYPTPHRLLVLFSAHNADKAPAPAAFEHRLAMMVLLAEDVTRRLKQARTQGNNGTKGEKVDTARGGQRGNGEARDGSVDERESTTRREDEGGPLSENIAGVDIGLTTQPFYNDKSAAIEREGVYPASCRHVHLVGFDTFVRILDPKYYEGHSPPLAALDGYFAKHGFRITMRPGDEWGDEDEQRAVWRRLASGEMEEQGGKAQWAEQIEMATQEDEGAQVSSTRVRKAVEQGDWGEVDRMCSLSVTEWLKKNEEIYKV